MSMLQAILGGAAAKATGWALIHVLWQASLIAAILGLVMLALRDRSANARYIAACIALVATIVLPVATGISSWEAMPDRSPLVGLETTAASGVSDVTLPADETQLRATTLTERISSLPVDNALPWVVAIWLAGVTILSMRLAWGLTSVSRLGRLGTSPVPPSVERTMNELADLLGLHRTVTIMRSRRIEVPTVIGWLEPVVLVPASALSGLSPHQLRTILAHELAHVRRHDFAVNLVQTAVETLLFFHPAVWWISRQVRIEREHCCDDIAVELCGDPVDYARALATMEELRSEMLPAVAASGGSLSGRIRRLLGIRNDESEAARPSIAIAAALGVTMAAVLPLFAGSYIYDAVVAPIAPGERIVVIGESDGDLDTLVDSVIEAHLAAADVRQTARQLNAEQLEHVRAEVERARAATAHIDASELARMAQVRMEVELTRATEIARIASATARAQLEHERATARLEAAVHEAERSEGLAEQERKELDALRAEVARAEETSFLYAELEALYADLDFVVAPVPPAPPALPAAPKPVIAPVPPIAPAVPLAPAPPAPPSFSFVIGNAPVVTGAGTRIRTSSSKPLDLENPTADDLIFMKSYDITPTFVREMQSAGLKDLRVRDLVILRSYNVRPATVKELRSLFGSELSAASIGAMAGMGIDAAWVREMRASGIELTPAEAIRMKSVGLDPRSLKAFEDLVGDRLSTAEAIRLQRAGVDPEYVRDLESVGLENLSASELARLRSVGVDAEYVKAMRSSGLTGLETGSYVRLKSMGIDGDYVSSIRQAGYPSIEPDELARLKSLGIDAPWIRAINGTRAEKFSVRDLLRMKSAGIDPEFLENWK